MPELAGVTVDEARLADVCARYGIARLRVFDSVACGTATPDSDIDVLYELEPARRASRRGRSRKTRSAAPPVSRRTSPVSRRTSPAS
jgi:predicted nucleotidyltransferase